MTFFARTGIFEGDTTTRNHQSIRGQGLHGQGAGILWLIIDGTPIQFRVRVREKAEKLTWRSLGEMTILSNMRDSLARRQAVSLEPFPAFFIQGASVKGLSNGKCNARRQRQRLEDSVL